MFKFIWDSRLNYIGRCHEIINVCEKNKIKNVDTLLQLCKRVCDGTRNKSTLEKTRLFDLVYWEECKLLQLMDNLLKEEMSVQFVQSTIKSHEEYLKLTGSCIYDNLTSQNKPYNKAICAIGLSTIKACRTAPELFRDMIRYKFCEISKDGYVNFNILDITQTNSTYNVCVTWDKINCKCNKAKRKFVDENKTDDESNILNTPNLTTLSNKKRKL